MTTLIKGDKKAKILNINDKFECFLVQCILEFDGFYREQLLANKTYKNEKKALEWANIMLNE